MRDPLVTIVIPCFNAEKYIRESLQSALSQTYPKVEVVVIDDGSTDGSLDIIRSFGNAIRWETGPNRGGCAARNRGIELARGEMIQFLDADDTLYPDKLRRQVDVALQVYPRIVYCDIERVVSNGLKQVISSPPVSDDSVVQMLLRNMLTPCPLHAKKFLVAVGGFRVGMSCSQEWDMHLRLACDGVQFYHLSETLCAYNLRPGSISQTSRCGPEKTAEAIMTAYSALQLTGKLTDARRRAFASKMAILGSGCLLGKTPAEKADKCFAWARQVHYTGGITADFGPWIIRVSHRVFGPKAGVFLCKVRSVGLKGILRRLGRLICSRRY